MAAGGFNRRNLNLMQLNQLILKNKNKLSETIFPWLFSELLASSSESIGSRSTHAVSHRLLAEFNRHTGGACRLQSTMKTSLSLAQHFAGGSPGCFSKPLPASLSGQGALAFCWSS